MIARSSRISSGRTSRVPLGIGWITPRRARSARPAHRSPRSSAPGRAGRDRRLKREAPGRAGAQRRLDEPVRLVDRVARPTASGPGRASSSEPPATSLRRVAPRRWTSSSASRPRDLAALRAAAPRSIRARSSARSSRSSRTSSSPLGAVWPVVPSRCSTVSTASSRSGSSAEPGTVYGIRAAAIFFFARVTRAAIVGSGPGTRGDLGRRYAAHEPQRQRDLRLGAPAPGGSR